MPVKRFEDLNSWKKARELTREVYQLTNRGGLAKDFALRDQLRRSAISVQSNIAEGFERSSRKEYMLLLGVAKASAGELRSRLYTALDLGYLDERGFKKLRAEADHISRMLFKRIEYLKGLGG